MHKQRDLSRYYSLRKNPKKKTQKSFALESLESMKKILFRCEECGKGFRYEKCLSNHKAGMHLSTNRRVYEESIKSMCSSFSLVKKKKRSRVMRYRNTASAWSFSTFLEPRSEFPENDGELEVAESLILLSKSTPKFGSEGIDANPETPKDCLSRKKPRKAGEFESTEERMFLRDSNKFDQQNRRKDGEFESEFLSKVQKLLEANETFTKSEHNCELDQEKLQKAGDFDSGFYRTELGLESMEYSESYSDMATESNKRSVEHQCRLCKKIFTSYQALGGHQTFHRMSKTKNKKSCREESVELEDESVRCLVKNKEHKCNICSRHFSSFHALGGHKKCHGKKQQLKTEDDREDLGLFNAVPVTV